MILVFTVLDAIKSLREWHNTQLVTMKLGHLYSCPGDVTPCGTQHGILGICALSGFIHPWL